MVSALVKTGRRFRVWGEIFDDRPQFLAEALFTTVVAVLLDPAAVLLILG